MATPTPANPERQFNRGAWLIVAFAIAGLVYGIVDFAYRFTLPTDGWEATEGYLPGLTYTKNLMGNPSGLQPGDRVTAVEGIPADWQTVTSSPVLRESWRVGASLDYTVIRGGQEISVPVTLIHWQFGKWLRATLLDPIKLAGLLSGTILLALAVFIFLRRPGVPAAGAFLLIIVILTGSRLSDTLPSGFSGWIDPIANVLRNNISWIFFLGLFPFALIRLALVFPHPKPIHQRHPWLSYAAGAIGLMLTVFAMGSPVGWYWFVFSLFLAVAILIHNAFTMRDAVSRAQLRWGLGGLIIGFGMLALMFLAGTSGLFLELSFDIFSLIMTFATMVMGIMLAVAIARYRLFDIDVIIRRTLVYTVVSGFLILAYLGSVVVLQSLLATETGESSPIAIVVSTLLIAALFNPLRRRVQDVIDRRFYRRRYDAQQVLGAFAATARDEVDLDQLTSELLRAVEETMRPEQVSLWLRPTQPGLPGQPGLGDEAIRR